MRSPVGRRLRRVLAAGPIGALIGVGLIVIPTTAVQAQVVHHTKAGEVWGALERTEVRRLPFPARHAALYWTGNPDAQVAVAFSRDGVTFGKPVAVEHDEVGMQRNNGQTYGAIVPAGDATFASVTTDRPLGRLTVLALAEDGTSVEQAPTPAKPAGAAATVLPRSGWGADENTRFRGPKPVWPPVFQTVQKVAVHHTAGANGETGETAKATIRAIYYYHAVTQGWGDIGYNFLIDAAGVVYKGRSTSSTKVDADTTGENASAQGVTAGHAYGYNSGTVGVALLGNFVAQLPTAAAELALKSLLTAKVSAHGLNAAFQAWYTNPVNGTQDYFENVPGHLEVPNNATECPGGLFMDRLRFLREEVRDDAALLGAPDATGPQPPKVLKAASGKRSVTLTWDGVTLDPGNGGGSSGVAGYDVFRNGVRVASTTSVSFTDNVRGTFTYTVRTFDGASNRGAPSNVATGTGGG
jgi:hypothetical protein